MRWKDEQVRDNLHSGVCNDEHPGWPPIFEEGLPSRGAEFADDEDRRDRKYEDAEAPPKFLRAHTMDE